MKIGIMVLSMGSFGKRGFYNLQEVGLAKALDSLCDEVKVYKLVPVPEENKIQTIAGTSHSFIHYLSAKNVGTNGIPNMDLIDKDIDALICFSDTQFALPKVYRWTQKNRIPLFPYIGVAESHSTSHLKRIIVNFLFRRNLSVYRKCYCLAKNPDVKIKLTDAGVKNTSVVPVGLDLSLMKMDWECFDSNSLKTKYGFSESNKVILFIGRLIEEKQPVRMIEILSDIRQRNQEYKLLMVGTGELKKAVEGKVKELNLEDEVKMIEKIPNNDIWELYCFADSFVNLNQQEIFGMAILEAMYYGCKVVAWEAPGPNLIIENGVSGCIVTSSQEVEDAVINVNLSGDAMRKRVLEHFTWRSAAERILSIAKM